MSINKVITSISLSLVLLASIAQIASAVTINANPADCKAAGGTPVSDTLCKLPD